MDPVGPTSHAWPEFLFILNIGQMTTFGEALGDHHGHHDCKVNKVLEFLSWAKPKANKKCVFDAGRKFQRFLFHSLTHKNSRGAKCDLVTKLSSLPLE